MPGHCFAIEVRRARACARACANRGWTRGLAAAAAVMLAMPAAIAQAQNLTYSEVKFGVLDHDPHFLKGKERGVDLNPEIILQSPIADSWAASLPEYVRWAVQPRPTLGGEINTAGFTDQGYFGATWTWQVAANLLRPDDGVTVSYFFGPSFNNGQTVARQPDRESLGSHVLFRLALELGYRIDPVWQISAMIDHESNAGLARQNQSLNDIGARIGIRF